MLLVPKEVESDHRAERVAEERHLAPELWVHRNVLLVLFVEEISDGVENGILFGGGQKFCKFSALVY